MCDTFCGRRVCLAALVGVLALGGAASGRAAESRRGGRLPIPGAEAQQKAEALVRDVYQVGPDADLPPSKKAELAKRLVDEAAKTNDNPVGRFVMFKMACNLGVEVGDAELIARSIDQMARYFEIDPASVKRTMLLRAAASPRNSAVARQVAEGCLRLMDRAVLADQFDVAMDCGRAAYTAAGSAKDAKLLGEVVERGRSVLALKKESEQVGEAAKVLAADPDDARANLACGRYACLVKEDWRRGLPMLAKGSDAELKAAAEKDLAQPATPAEQVAVADAWWNMADAKTGREHRSLRGRAAWWYRKAQGGAKGLDETKATKRLAEWKGFARAEAPQPKSKGKGPRPKTHQPAKAPPKTLDVPQGQWADLLKQLDVKKHRVVGDWQFRGGKLMAVPAGGAAAMVVPVVPRGSYELEMQFTRTSAGMLGLVLPVGPRQCLAALDCRPGVHGLDTVDGKRADGNDSTARGELTTGRQYRLGVSVAVDGNEAAVTVSLDDRPLFFYRGPAAALALHKEFTTKQRTALALVARCGVVFHSLKLRMKTGSAQVLP